MGIACLEAARLEVQVELHWSEVGLVELGIQPAGDVTSIGHCGAHPNQLEAVLAAKLSAPGLPLLVGQLGQQQLQYVAPVIVSNLPSQNTDQCRHRMQSIVMVISCCGHSLH